MTAFRCGRGLRGPAAATLLCAVVLAALVAIVGAPAQAELVKTPLCAEMHGFAGEFSDHYIIPVERALATGEAIVLIARAFPFNLGNMLSQWLYVNATYRITDGATFSQVSDNNGILVLTNVAAGTDIEVRVVRVRPDGPVPFRFFSFVANSPVCHVSVAPDNSFIAPVPHNLAAGSTAPVTMYFKTILPSSSNALTVRVNVDGHPEQKFRTLDKDGAEREHTSGDLVQAGSGNIVVFSFAAPSDSSSYCFTTVSVSYGEWDAPAAGGKGGDTQSPTQPSSAAPEAAPSSSSSSSSSMSALRKLMWIAIFLFILYQSAVAVFNYRVLGKRDIMEIVPCAEAVAAGARTVQLATTRGLGAAQRQKDGYDSLRNPDDPYA